MYYVGIDIAKYRHVAFALDEAGRTISGAYAFDNTAKGFAELLMHLGSVQVTHNTCLVGMESTGHYWFNLHEFLETHGFNVVVINPIQTDAYRKVDTVRLTKTDPVDARLIADLIRVKEFQPSHLTDEVVNSLKQLTRYRMSLVDDTTRLKNKATAILDRIFPEYATVFPRLYGPTSKAVLQKCATPELVLKTGLTRLTRIILETSNGRCGREKAEELIAAARVSVGVTFSADALALEVGMLIKHMNFHEEQIKDLDLRIGSLLSLTPGKWLTTIPGIGSTLAAQIAAEIGDAQRFSSSKKLVAYAGMDASKSQSGLRDEKGRITKRGSSQLRYALIQAADGARRNDEYFGEYYAAKVRAGMNFYQAVACVARKLTGVVLAIMKEERAYQPVPPKHHLPGHCLVDGEESNDELEGPSSEEGWFSAEEEGAL